MFRHGWLLVLAVLLSVNAGCAVLTKSQVKEVSKFAVAAKGYGEMPGSVIAEHGRIRKTRMLLLASTQFNGEQALKTIELALEQNAQLTRVSREADAALKVLQDYADLLVKLSSDDFTNELQASAETLCKSVDKGIGAYNAAKGTSLTAFGSGVAAIVRGIGGVYIRCEQEKALKEAISKADPIIQSLTEAVEETMASYLDEDQLAEFAKIRMAKGLPGLTPKAYLSEERASLAGAYKDAVSRYEGKQPPCLPLTVAEEMSNSDDAAKLAINAIKAAGSYRAAHARLAASVLKKQELKDVIEEIQVLAAEVKSAQDLKKKLDK